MKLPNHKPTFQEEWIELEGSLYFVKHIKWEQNKDIPTLVFLHDALGSISQWKGFPEKLAHASKLNCTLIDRQGHGKSSPFSESRQGDYLHKEAWIVLPQLLKLLRIELPILIGHSDGGSIALLFGGREKTFAIISIAAHVFVENITLEGIQKAVNHETELKAKLTKYHGEKASALFDAWANTWLDEDFRGFNIEEQIRGVTAPTLIIQGVDDKYGTHKQVDSIVAHIQSPIRKVCWIKDGGHMPHLEKTEQLLEAILSFLKEIYPSF